MYIYIYICLHAATGKTVYGVHKSIRKTVDSGGGGGRVEGVGRDLLLWGLVCVYVRRHLDRVRRCNLHFASSLADRPTTRRPPRVTTCASHCCVRSPCPYTYVRRRRRWSSPGQTTLLKDLLGHRFPPHRPAPSVRPSARRALSSFFAREIPRGPLTTDHRVPQPPPTPPHSPLPKYSRLPPPRPYMYTVSHRRLRRRRFVVAVDGIIIIII